MRYTVTTFKVRLEVCDVGERTGASEDVSARCETHLCRARRRQRTFCSACAQQQEPGSTATK